MKSKQIWSYIHAERKRPGVTLELLHLEYVEQHPDGLRYSSFCQHYQAWAKARGDSNREIGSGAQTKVCWGVKVRVHSMPA